MVWFFCLWWYGFCPMLCGQWIAVKNLHSSSWHITIGKWTAPAVAVVEHLKWHCPHVGLPLRPAGVHHLIWEESFFQICIRCFPVANSCCPVSQSKAYSRAIAMQRVSTPACTRACTFLLVPSKNRVVLNSVALKLSVSFGLAYFFDLENKMLSLLRNLCVSSRSPYRLTH